MSALARRNGWRGFDGIGERVEGGWEYRCDGMPTMFGCGETITIPRRWSKVGPKRASGWLVCYGRDHPEDLRADGRWGDDGKGNDLDVVLTFGPTCAAVVRGQTSTTPADPEWAALTEGSDA